MITHQHLSAYTPSNMDAETLEAMFVQRHKLLESSVKWVTESVTTDKKNHLLFVGARGSGKTHLVSMIINRLKENEATENTKVIWLGEDDVVMNLADLALLIIRKMAQHYPDAFNTDCLAIAKGKKANEVAEIILDDIKKQAGNDTLLIVKENLSDVFAGLKDAGQKKLRAYLQENHHISILGTSQKLFDAISNRKEAFWGFFDVHHLQTLSVEDASQLISNIAKINQNDDLVNFLATAQGKYRIRALHYLAGGNHRLYVELASFLTMESLDDFVMAITQLADHLTPYFQERIRSLSPQQARIIQKLCELSGAIQVKVIAEELFLEERAVASQLKALKDMGYVISHKRGRASYYEVAEPLLRLSLEVKNSRGEPLKIIASLFRAWFSDDDLKEKSTSENMLIKRYSEAALKQDGILNKIKDLLFSELKQNDTSYSLDIANQILCSPNLDENDKAIALIVKSRKLFEQDNYIQAIDLLTEIIEMSSVKNVILALNLRGSLYELLDKTDEAIKDFDSILTYDSVENEILIKTILSKSELMLKAKMIDEGLECIENIFLIDGLSIENKAKAMLLKSQFLKLLNRMDDALKTLQEVLQHKKEISNTTLGETLIITSAYYLLAKNFEKSMEYIELALKEVTSFDKNDLAFLMFLKVDLYYQNTEIKLARQALTKALKKIEPENKMYAFNIDSILQSISELGSSSWKDELSFIFKLVKQNNLESKLTAAIIESIYDFVSNEFQSSSFKLWIEIWKEISGNDAQVQPAIQALDASAKALEAGNDKPLFVLPKEIRELILPMFEGKFKK